MPNSPTEELTIRRVARLDLVCDDWHWPFAEQRRADIDRHFAHLRESRPQLWNGQVLLAREPRFHGDSFRARYFQTDFASFLAWRDWGFSDRTVFNGFGMGALRSRDGAFMLGEMAAHTANAGRVYFPSGTPDPSDRYGDTLDMAGSVAREVAEETGLSPDSYEAAPEWHCVTSGALVAMMRVLEAQEPAATLAERIAAHIVQDSEGELAAVHVVHGTADITPAMPNFVAAFLTAQFGASSALARQPADV